jgi:aminoglycoside phosphotransferase (APT) family kinase protein
MMRVRREGAWVRKALTDAVSARSGFWLARRSRLLAARGVRTPVACYDAPAREIVSPWIAGTSGPNILRREGRDAAGGGPAIEGFLAACLLPLVHLHGVDPAGLELAPLDPWRRIGPRLLALHADKAREEAGAIYRAALRARRSIKRRFVEIAERAALAEQVVAHGDYHVGQLLFASPMDEPWLLDLDDLALAPRESDLGNFAAHLATVEERAVDTFDAFCALASLVCRLYESLVGHEVDRDMVGAYGAIALVRRSLKLHERGARTGIVIDLLSAAERVSQRLCVGWRGAPAFLASGDH